MVNESNIISEGGETNVIETVTPEEYIRDTFQNVSDSEKEQVCGTVSKPTPKQF